MWPAKPTIVTVWSPGKKPADPGWKSVFIEYQCMSVTMVPYPVSSQQPEFFQEKTETQSFVFFKWPIQ